MIKKLTTNRGNEAIAHNGYIYMLKSKSRTKKIWKCFQRGCNAKIHIPIEIDELVEENMAIRGMHNCRPVPDVIKRMENRKNIISEALNTEKSPRHIITNVLSLQNQSQISVTGTQHSLEQIIGRSRSMILGGNIIAEPALNIGTDMMRTLRGGKFYQFGPNMLRNLEETANFAVFFDESSVGFFKRSKVWSIDGTFSVCPRPWTQLYTISVIVDHHVIPFVYALLKFK